ncbi:phosphodiester glycosidase family protein [Candidatus Woesebacteria bacterium]|nr:phosphodiester glycosidase family protein [Candidatus Woesebacteria bacterium]
MSKIKVNKIKKLFKGKSTFIGIVGIVIISASLTITTYLANQNSTLKQAAADTQSAVEEKAAELDKVSKEYEDFKNIDQVKINEKLNETVSNVEDTYQKAVSSYEELLKLKEKTDDDLSELDELYARALSELSSLEYATAEATLAELDKKISGELQKIAEAQAPKVTAPESNAPPGSGYSRQYVNTPEAGQFLVSMVAADISSTKVIVDTAADSNCGNDCPVLPLSEYISRNGAYAGINGSYFCPATYPSCQGKTNSFDLLAMNHKKTYFNSDNNVYSGNPVVIFGDGYVRFVASGSEWGRDTSPNGVLMNYPLLLMNGEVRFGGDDDPKKGSKGGRSFVANKGSSVYIGVVHSATVAESARVMKALGFENAMNLDDGGSTALWSGGYKVGPGRNLPNVILFVSK